MEADAIDTLIVIPRTHGTASSAPLSRPFPVVPGLVHSGQTGWAQVELAWVAQTPSIEDDALRVADVFSNVGVAVDRYRDALLETGYDERPEYVSENRPRDERIERELGPVRGKVNREVIR